MKIAIAGYGVEGEENYLYWKADSDNQLTIVDEAEAPSHPVPEGAATILGEGAFDKLADFDLVVRTASLDPQRIHTNGKVWSATNEFFARCQAQIIGVTGSKGKGTTASLITSILEAAGKKVWFVGNIGTPALSVLSKISSSDVVVYELSSFQLWDLQRSPHSAVVLHIEPEHLNVHPDMHDYVTAKAHIAQFQTPNDKLVYSVANEHAQKIAEVSQAEKIGFPSEQTAHIRENMFYYGDQALCPVDALQLRGEHNQLNAIAAIDAVWSYTKDVHAIEAGLRAFKGLPHRLAYVASVNDVAYYDDSIATTPSSAIAALRSFSDVPKVIILGGSSKGSDYTELAQELTQHEVHALLIGDEAQKIAETCQREGFTDFEMASGNAEDFTRRAQELARPGGVVLLSPASASFGLFRDYADRGDQFVAAVKNLGSAH